MSDKTHVEMRANLGQAIAASRNFAATMLKLRLLIDMRKLSDAEWVEMRDSEDRRRELEAGRGRSFSIHKHAIKWNDLDFQNVVKIQTHIGARVLMVAAQRDGDELPALWLQVHEAMRKETTEFLVVPTGGTILNNFTHVGSAVCAGGSLIWHIYQREAP